MKRIFCLFLACFIFLSSCSIKKRTYRKGYYIDYAFNKNSEHSSPEKSKTRQPKKIDHSQREIIIKADQNNDLPVLAVVDNKIDDRIIKNEKPFLLGGDSACGDIINFRSGKVLTAKVMEITADLIKYKRCDNLEGPIFSVNKNDIASIQYPNGTIEAFEQTYVPSPSPKPVKKPVPDSLKRVHPLAWVVLGFTIALPLLGLLSLLAIWLITPYAEMRIKQKPDIYKGLKLLDVCDTIMRVYVGLILLALVLVIAIILALA